MKSAQTKVYPFLLVMLLFVVSATANAQEYFNGRLVKQRQSNNLDSNFLSKPRAGISIQPFAAFGSGLDVAYDVTSKKYLVRAVLGYYTNQEPNMLDRYNNFVVENQSYQLRNMKGFKAEIQASKVVGTSRDGRTMFTAGLFANYRTIGGSLGAPNESSSINYLNLGKKISTYALMAGPIMSINYIASDFLYMGSTVGMGVVSSPGDDIANEFHIDQVNPYKNSISFKFNAWIGIYLR